MFRVFAPISSVIGKFGVLPILITGAVFSRSFAESSESIRCITATAQVERALHIPDGFLAAMSRVETGRSNGDGTISAWPWTINAAGTGYHYNSLQDAVAAVKAFQSQGIKSIDVGCMQVNIMHHPDAFPSLEMAFDPYSNALFAGQFLKQMFDQKGSWPRAAAAYHSQTPGIGEPYLWRVIEEWSIPQDGKHKTSSLLAKHSPLFAMSRKANSAQTTQSSPAVHAHVKYFKPFKGGYQKFSDLSSVSTPNHYANNGPTGRTLASYRAARVRLSSTMPQPAAY